MTPSIRSVASAALAALALAGGSSRAQGAESPRTAAARVAVTAAQRAYEQGKFEDALIAYNSAYELSELPVLLFNLAQCHRQLRHYERAVFFYTRYLELQPPPIGNEALTRSLLAEMQEATAARNAPSLSEQLAALGARSAMLEREDVPPQALPEPPAPAPDPAVPTASRVEPSASLVKQWWLWTIVGVVVTGGAVAAGVIASQGYPAPAPTTVGEIRF